MPRGRCTSHLVPECGNSRMTRQQHLLSTMDFGRRHLGQTFSNRGWEILQRNTLSWLPGEGSIGPISLACGSEHSQLGTKMVKEKEARSRRRCLQ